ncbi:MAG TPA: hypothetical protein VEI47_04745 [Gemmatimonadales bacterium]|nr:hypothetical protein [Gemmatimonadales bacterium]
MRRLELLLALLLGVGGCKPATARPYFPPVTGAAQAEVELVQKNATTALADVLRSDSLPLVRVVEQDGYIETAWFDAGTKQVAHGRHLGPDVVQIRAWIDPTRLGYSKMTVETVYRPLADASLSPRELDRQVPPDHPVGKRMLEIVTELARLYNPEPTRPGAPAEPGQPTAPKIPPKITVP